MGRSLEQDCCDMAADSCVPRTASNRMENSSCCAVLHAASRMRTAGSCPLAGNTTLGMGKLGTGMVATAIHIRLGDIPTEQTGLIVYDSIDIIQIPYTVLTDRHAALSIAGSALHDSCKRRSERNLYTVEPSPKSRQDSVMEYLVASGDKKFTTIRRWWPGHARAALHKRA